MEYYFYNDNGKAIGWVEDVKGEMTFRKRVQGSKHLFQKLNAWAIDEDAVMKMKEKWTTQIQILDTESHILYQISYDRFVKNSETRDYGYGRQVFCNRKFFDTKQI